MGLADEARDVGGAVGQAGSQDLARTKEDFKQAMQWAATPARVLHSAIQTRVDSHMPLSDVDRGLWRQMQEFLQHYFAPGEQEPVPEAPADDGPAETQA